MADRYCVVDRSGLVVDSIMLDGPESTTSEFRYVLCDGSAGIGWTLTDAGPVPPADAAQAPVDVQAEIDMLQAKLDALREVAAASSPEVVDG